MKRSSDQSQRIAVMLLACGLLAGTSAAQDVTRPGDPIVASSGNYPGGEPPESAIDNTAATKYLNFDRLNTGFTVTPSGTGVVRSLVIVTANDAPERDPTSYILEGSNDGTNFSLISQGTLVPQIARFALSTVSFANTAVYTQYRVTFPTVRANSNSMQVAEVQLNTNINVLGAGATVATTYTNGGHSNLGEGAENLVDNLLDTKMGIFGGGDGETTIDFVPAAGSSVITGGEIFGGNDDESWPGRTPSTLTLLGSNDGVTFTQLYTGSLTQVSRNYEGQEFTFSNTVAYSRYRVVLGASSDYFTQVGEIRLMGTVVSTAAPNDTCGTAQVVVAGANPGNNLHATGTDSTPCGTDDSLDVWYTYHAVNSGLTEVNTIGTGSLDTTLAIYDGCGGPLLGCDDNSNGSKSRIRFQAVANHDYKIRVAGAFGTAGSFTLNIDPAPVVHIDQRVALNYNFNGMVHSGESGVPDASDGYRTISDRGLRITGEVGSLDVGLEGRTGIPYTVITQPNTLDIVHLGDRNLVDNSLHQFNDIPDDDFGIQPNWLPDTNQTAPQTTVLPTPVVMSPNAQIGVLFDASNGGTTITCRLNFASGDPILVDFDAPDWFGLQHPLPPGPGVQEQETLGVYAGADSNDQGYTGVPLNVVESVVTTASLTRDGFDALGRQLVSISFSTERSFEGANVGTAIFAVTLRDATLACTADFNNDTVVDFFDYLDFVQAFASNESSSDFNHDSVIDFFDYLDFVQAFAAGC